MFILLVTFAVLSSAAKTAWHKLDESYSFEKFVKEHNIRFKNEDDKQVRKGLFAQELQRVLNHNKKNLSWKEGMNKFSVMTASEKKVFHGRSKNVAAAAKKEGHLKHSKPMPANLNRPINGLPSSVDWRKKGIMSAVKDQGHCGSCWAFASTATVESYVALATGQLFDLSPEQIAMCAPNPNSCGGTGGCEGATAEIAFEYLASASKTDGMGHFEEFQYPYLSYSGKDMKCDVDSVLDITAPKGTIDGYVQLPTNNYTALMNAVATQGPISISVDASVWHSYEGGVFDGCNQENPDIDHAVQLVGYGEEDGKKYWLVRNSWSASFGEAGYIKIARSDDDDKNCGLDITPQDGSACDGDTASVTVCGTCGILADSAYPTGAGLV